MSSDQSTNFHAEIDKLFHDWNYSTPKLLYGLVRCLRPEVIVECGVYRAYTTCWLAQACKENGKGRVFGIDNFSLTDHLDRYPGVTARQHAEDNLRKMGVADFATFVEGDSREVQWPEKIDFAYIDGWHGYEVAANEFDHCAKRGSECICFDDAEQSVGPRLVVEQIRATEAWDVINVSRDCGMAICMRKQPLHPITFSQEQEGHTGHDLQAISKAAQLAHLQACSAANGVDYSRIIPSLHPGILPIR